MATVGAAVPSSAAFPLERFMVATIRLGGLLVGLWGLLQAATGMIVSIAFMVTTSNTLAESDSFTTTTFSISSVPLVASAGSGLVMLVGGVVVFAMARRLARFVTKDL